MKMNNMGMKKNNMMAEEAVKEGFSMGKPKKESVEYPYCLRLYLGHEELMSLGIDKLPPLGSEVMVHAKAMVLSQRLNDENCKTMELQITDMCVETGKTKNMEDTIYSSEDNGDMED